VTPAVAATTHIAFTTAHAGLHRRAGLRAGETLLVTSAAGGTGNAAVQMGAVAGARVIAVASGADRRRICLDLGAEAALDPDDPDLAKAVLAANDGRGVDVVFEPVGGALFAAATRCVASEGRIVVVGFAGGDEGAVRPGHLLRRNYTVMGLYMGAYSGPAHRGYMLSMHDEIMALLASGRCRALIDRETGLDGAATALTDLAARKVTGRPIVIP
jgi:NADPH2:quinone reductase